MTKNTATDPLLLDESMMTIAEMVNSFFAPAEEIADNEEGISMLMKISKGIYPSLQVIARRRECQKATPPLYKMKPVLSQYSTSFNLSQ